MNLSAATSLFRLRLMMIEVCAMAWLIVKINRPAILITGGLMYQKLDGRNWRHIWIAGDIHGCYQWLMDELARRNFIPGQDLLISVGDLIDRGPDSIKCLELMR